MTNDELLQTLRDRLNPFMFVRRLEAFEVGLSNENLAQLQRGQCVTFDNGEVAVTLRPTMSQIEKQVEHLGKPPLNSVPRCGS